MENIILEVKNISKSFPGVKALDNVNFSLKKGEVHALVGENGSGKSTLVKILSGAYIKEEGEIIIKGNILKETSIDSMYKKGIQVVYQEPTMIPELNCIQNIFLGIEKMLGNFPGFLDYVGMRKDCQKLMNSLKIEIDINKKIKELKLSKIYQLEIAKAISCNSEIIILDEVTASLSFEEVSNLFQTINELKKRGVSIIFISHRLEEIFAISDRITVLRDGKLIDVMNTKDVNIDILVEKVVGKRPSNEYKEKSPVLGKELLQVKGFTKENVFNQINFSLFAGEVLGIAGLEGSGRTEILEGISGCGSSVKGDIFIKGKKIIINNPSIAIKNGIARLPENRREEGLVLGLSVENNIILAVASKLTIKICKLLNINKKNKMVNNVIKMLGIKTPGPKYLVDNLSGGNQQKVVIGKWILTNCDILLLDEPTRGIDVGAKAEVYAIIEKIAKTGKGIVLVSSEIKELLCICQRILVIYKGSIVKELLVPQSNEEEVVRYMLQMNRS
jgi:ribose transport system ATP-binding protein